MKKIIRKETVVVPQGCVSSVLVHLMREEIDYAVHDAHDEEGEETVTLAVSYEKDEREAFHEMEDIIQEYEASSGDDEDEDDED